MCFVPIPIATLLRNQVHKVGTQFWTWLFFRTDTRFRFPLFTRTEIRFRFWLFLGRNLLKNKRNGYPFVSYLQLPVVDHGCTPKKSLHWIILTIKLQKCMVKERKLTVVFKWTKSLWSETMLFVLIILTDERSLALIHVFHFSYIDYRYPNIGVFPFKSICNMEGEAIAHLLTLCCM